LPIYLSESEKFVKKINKKLEKNRRGAESAEFVKYSKYFFGLFPFPYKQRSLRALRELEKFDVSGMLGWWPLCPGRARLSSYGHLSTFWKAKAQGPVPLDLRPFPWYF